MARRFTIGETGFGTGLNILAAWDLWRRVASPGARLEAFSCEAYPLAPEDLERALSAYPALTPLARRLCDLYPPPVPGAHRLQLAPDMALTLLFGDAQARLAGFDAAADAWFLDGFAPARNPEMWSPALIGEVARLSRPGATAATFTVAGAVRRALAASRFSLERRPGFGGKREMLAARFEGPAAGYAGAPWFAPAPAPPLPPGAPVAIVGGGVAGASAARALTRAGLAPTLYDPGGLAAGASGNPAGLIAPRLDLGPSAAADFFRLAYLHAVREIAALEAETGAAIFASRGVLQAPADAADADRQQRLVEAAVLPPDWMRRDEDGLIFPQAGVVDPGAFVRALAGATPVLRAGIVDVRPEPAGPVLTDDRGVRRRVAAVILANGVAARDLAEGLQLAANAGQLDLFQTGPTPRVAVAAGPYAAPAPGGGLVLGATYAPHDGALPPAVSRAATRANIAAAAPLAGVAADSLDPDAAHPRAGLRAQTPDRLPIAGAAPDVAFFRAAYAGLRTGPGRDWPTARRVPGVYLLCGLGSRGLVTAPLLGALLAAALAGAPPPACRATIEAVDPARFPIRALKRGVLA